MNQGEMGHFSQSQAKSNPIRSILFTNFSDYAAVFVSRAAVLRKSAGGRVSRFHGQTCSTTSVTGMPTAPSTLIPCCRSADGAGPWNPGRECSPPGSSGAGIMCGSLAQPGPGRPGAADSRRSRSTVSASCRTAPTSLDRFGWRRRCRSAVGHDCRSALHPGLSRDRTRSSLLSASRSSIMGEPGPDGQVHRCANCVAKCVMLRVVLVSPRIRARKKSSAPSQPCTCAMARSTSPAKRAA